MSITLTTPNLVTRVPFAEPVTLTAGDIEVGDFLVETVRYRGVPGHTFERLVERVAEGPSFHGSDWDSPSSVGRVRVSLTSGQSPLLYLGTPVVVRRPVYSQRAADAELAARCAARSEDEMAWSANEDAASDWADQRAAVRRPVR